MTECPKCGSRDIRGPFYRRIEWDEEQFKNLTNRLKFVCPCGYEETDNAWKEIEIEVDSEDNTVWVWLSNRGCENEATFTVERKELEAIARAILDKPTER